MPFLPPNQQRQSTEGISMTYTLFFIPDYQFQKVFYVSLGNNLY